MAIEVELHDGRILEFPDNTRQEVIDTTVRNVLRGSSAQKESTLGSELVRGGKQVVSGLQTAAESLFTSPEEASQRGMQRSAQIAEEAGEGPSLARIKRVYEQEGLMGAAGQVLSDIPKALSGQAANLAGMAASAKLGAMAGTAVAPGPGTLVGGALGAGAYLLPQFYGSNIETQAAEDIEAGRPVDIESGKALAAATGQAALEAGGTAFVLGKNLVKGFLGLKTGQAVAGDAARAALLKQAQQTITGGAVRGLGEIPVEIAQQVLERAQAGLDVMSDDAFTEYGEVAYQAGLVGSTLGGAGNVIGRRAAKRELEQEEAAAPTAPGKLDAEEVARRQAEIIAAQEGEVEPAPAAPSALTIDDVKATGASVTSYLPWFKKNVVGRTVDEVRAMVEATPDLVAGKSGRAQALKALITPEPPVYQEPVDEQAPRRAGVRPEPAVERPAVEPSVGVPSGVTQQPAGAQPTPTTAVEPLERDGVAPSEPTVGAQLELARPTTPAVTETELGPQAPEAIETEAQGAQPQALGAAKPRTRARPAAEPVEAPRLAPTGLKSAAEILSAERPEDAVATAQAALDTAESTRGDAGLALYDARDAFEAGAIDQAALDTAERAYAKATKAAEDARAALLRVQPKETLPKEPGRTAQRASDFALIDSAVEAYNAPADSEAMIDIERRDVKAMDAVRYLVGVSQDPSETKAARERAQKALDDQVSKGDIDKVRAEVTEPEVVPKGEISTKAMESLESGDVVTPLRSISETSDSKEISALATRLADYLAGVEVKVESKLKHPTTKKRVRGLAQGDRITLDRETGLDEETVLHEAIHAATLRVLEMSPSKRTPAQAEAVAELQSVFDKIKKLRPDLAQTEEFSSLQEFVAASLSNRNLQSLLRRTKYTPADSAWKVFTRAIMKMLGVAKPKTALDATLAAVDTILTAPELGSGQRSAVYAAATNKPVNAQQALNMVKTSGVFDVEPGPVRKALTAMTTAVSSSAGTSAIDKFRTVTVDNAASVVSRLNALFDNAVRTASGLMNPEGLIRQAQDFQQLLLPFLKFGTLTKDPNTNGYVVEDKGKPSMERVFKRVEAWGKKNGMSFDAASNLVSKAFESVRLDGIRTLNATLPDGKKIQLHKLNPKLGAKIDQQIDDMLAFYNSDQELKDIKADLDAIKNDLIDHLVRVGRISAQEGSAWKDAVDYVPFDRIGSPDKPFRIVRKTGRGLAALGGLPELIGTKTYEVGNVLENSVKLQGWMIGQILHQDATLTTLRMLEAMGSATDMGKRQPEDKSLMVKTYVKGDERYYALPDRYMAAAFVQMTWPSGPVVKFAQGVSNVLRKTITALPPFAATQLVKDVQRIFVQSGLKNPYAVVFPTLKHFIQISGYELFGKDHPLLRKVQQYGISGNYDIDLRDPARDALVELGFRARGKLQTLGHRLEAITRASDVAARIAVYERTMKETQGDTALASMRAREFINFRRRGSGSMVPVLVATIPFFNAYLQGMDVLYRQATGKGSSSGIPRSAALKSFWSRIGTMIGLSIIYTAAVSGEDDYENLDARVKAGNFIIPGTGIRIPVAGELGMIFKVPVEAAAKYLRTQGTEEEVEAAELTMSVIRYALEQVSGGGVPAVIKPLLENLTNYSFFTGRPLEGTYQQTLDIQERTTSQTSEVAKLISETGAEIFGKDKTVSPVKIDNFLRGYFGTAASTVTMAADQYLNPDRLDRPLNKYWFFSSFMYDKEARTARKNEAYEWNEKAGRRLATFRKMIDTDPERADAYYEKHEPDILLAEMLEQTFKEAGEIRRWINELNSSPLLAEEYTKEEREQLIREAKEYEQELFAPLRAERNWIKNQ